MISKPASRIPVIFGSLFVAIVGIMLLGSWWFKQTAGKTYIPALEENEGQNSELAQSSPSNTSVILKLTPTTTVGSSETFELSVEGLSQPANGIVFELKDAPQGTELVSSAFTTSQEVSQQGWSNILNERTSTAEGQTLSFSMVRTTTDTPATQPSVKLGTVTFELNNTSVADELTLNSEESMVTYSSGESAPLKLIVEN